MDAHPGNGINAVRSLSANVTNDPAVVNQNRAPSTNPHLDPFDARNGYRDDGLTLYSDSFKRRYFEAQSERMNYLISEALSRLAEVDATGAGDAPFIVPLAGIDWCSSNNTTPCNLQQMTVPLLVTTMAGHYFIRDAEQYFDMAASPDKDYYVIEGATHGGTECTACETTPGQYSNATKNLFDLMQRWINARF